LLRGFRFGPLGCWCCRSCPPSSLLGRPWPPTSRLAPPWAIAADRVMPPRRCFAARALAAAWSSLSVDYRRGYISRVGSFVLLQPALQLRCLGGGGRPYLSFLAVFCWVVVEFWGANHFLCGSVSRFIFAVLSAPFFLMKRHVKSCSRKKKDQPFPDHAHDTWCQHVQHVMESCWKILQPMVCGPKHHRL
jgi:hypothetical protein